MNRIDCWELFFFFFQFKTILKNIVFFFFWFVAWTIVEPHGKCARKRKMEMVNGINVFIYCDFYINKWVIIFQINLWLSSTFKMIKCGFYTKIMNKILEFRSWKVCCYWEILAVFCTGGFESLKVQKNIYFLFSLLHCFCRFSF